MEKEEYYNANLEPSENKDVFNFEVFKDNLSISSFKNIVSVCDSHTSNSNEITVQKRRRIEVIESESEDSPEDVDIDERDVATNLEMPDNKF